MFFFMNLLACLGVCFLRVIYYSVYDLRPSSAVGKVMSHAVDNYKLRSRYSFSSILTALNWHQRVIRPVDYQCGHGDGSKFGLPVFLS